VSSWLSFACVLIKGEVFKQVGLLDEGFFMYFEDAEFCRRARQSGWLALYYPHARVVHLRGRSSPVKAQTRSKKRLARYYYESRTRYFYLSYGWHGVILANLAWWLGRLISKPRQILGRVDKVAVESYWLDIWTNWRRPLRPYTQPD
jgi:GT2 family glycosyltransferase